MKSFAQSSRQRRRTACRKQPRTAVRGLEALESRAMLATFNAGSWGWSGALVPDNVIAEAVASDSAGNISVAGRVTDVAGRTTDLGQGLVAQYLFDGNALDGSGNGLHGVVNAAVATTDRFGNPTGAMYFNGSAWARVEHVPSLNSFPITVSAWFRSTAQNPGHIVTKYENGTWNGWGLGVQKLHRQPNSGSGYYLASRSSAVISEYDGYPTFEAGQDLNDGAWHQLVMVVDQASGRLYLDGVLADEQIWRGTPSAPTAAWPMYFGHYSHTFAPYAENAYFTGSIDDVRIYDRALSAADVGFLHVTESQPPNRPPSLVSLSATTVAENQPVGTTVGVLSTSDPDVGDTFTYTLIADPSLDGTGVFEIVGNQLRTREPLDFEAKSSYRIRVRSTDQGGLHVGKVFTITVTNVNDSPKLISAARLSRIPGEGYARLAQDQFVLQAGVQYRFTARFPTIFTPAPPDNIPEFWGNGVAVQTTSENVTRRDGWTYYEAISTPESTGTYALVLALWSDVLDVADISVRPAAGGEEMVRNGRFAEGLSQWYTLGGQMQLVDVPLLSQPVASLPESTSTLSRVKVTDVRFADGSAGTHRVSLSGPDASSFEVDGTSVYVKAGVRLDYEVKRSYSITVGISDSSSTGGQSLASNFSLSLTNVNEAPIDIALSAASIAENAGVAAVVGTLSTADPDVGSVFTYTLISDTGLDGTGVFEIVGNELRTRQSLNFEAKTSYRVRVRSTDQGGLHVGKVFTISVTDVNEPPAAVTFANATTTLPESTSTQNRIKLADVVVTDDALGNNTLALSGPDAGSFEIDGRAIYLKAGLTLNYEAKTSYLVAVNVVDNSLIGSIPLSASYALAITDVPEPRSAPRVVSPAFFTVVEDTPTALTFPAEPFSDADSPLAKVMTVSMAVSAGSIAAASGAGVTVSRTPGLLTFTGALGSLNAYFTATPSRIVYTPGRDATSVATVSFAIAEAYGTQTLGSRATSQLRITPVNDAPVVFAPARFVVREDTRTNLGWPMSPAGFRDVDSASLTVTLSIPDGSLFAAPVAGVNVAGTPTSRILAGSPAALTAYFKTLGRIAYTPALDNTVPRTLTTTVSDGIDTRVLTSTIAITPVNDVPRILAAAVINGSSSPAPLEITYETLQAATGATDVETASPTLVIQSVLSGTLQRWNGTTWVRVPSAVGAPLAQRTLHSGQKLRWIPPSSSTGLQQAFRVTASDGVAESAPACTVRILRA
jgi:hypothetical protein